MASTSSIPTLTNTSASIACPILCTTLSIPHDPLTLTSLSSASLILQAGGLVAFPTETVYGLGASALSQSAVSKIYKAKGRPSDNPLIVHVSSEEMLWDLIPDGKAGVPTIYEPLIKKFWPGPLSMIFPLTEKAGAKPPIRRVTTLVTAGLPSLAIRMPSHPLALSLIRQSNLPLAAPSANLSSRPSPTTAAHVFTDLGTNRGLGAILDGGECQVGVESTVVDFVIDQEGRSQVRILRAGGVSAEELEECLREAGFHQGSAERAGSGRSGPGNKVTSRMEPEQKSNTHQPESARVSRSPPTGIQIYARDFKSHALESAPTTPGMKYKHYSPTNSRVVLIRPLSASQSPASSFGGLPLSLLELIHSTLASHDAASNESNGTTMFNRPRRIGLMLTAQTLSRCSPISTTPYSSNTRTSSTVDRIILPASPTPSSSSLESNSRTGKVAIAIEVLNYSLGSINKPLEAAQRLFAGLRYYDSLAFVDSPASSSEAEGRQGVDLILIECLEEVGVGLAVMERAKKAAGGTEETEFRCM